MTCLPERQHYRKHKDSPESAAPTRGTADSGIAASLFVCSRQGQHKLANFVENFLGMFSALFSSYQAL